MRTKFARSTDRLARWYWDGDDLVQDDFFDVQEQWMRHSAYDDQRPMFEVGFTLDVTEHKPPGQ
ncbi:hypothetical protein [Streptomyces sp. NPDC051572]|uniref:hypothetical protein n=1 Tax=Streptomyces sp. NPDC051572 TaxID=3155802 RepID=UPI00344DB09A